MKYPRSRLLALSLIVCTGLSLAGSLHLSAKAEENPITVLNRSAKKLLRKIHHSNSENLDRNTLLKEELQSFEKLLIEAREEIESGEAEKQLDELQTLINAYFNSAVILYQTHLALAIPPQIELFREKFGLTLPAQTLLQLAPSLFKQDSSDSLQILSATQERVKVGFSNGYLSGIESSEQARQEGQNSHFQLVQYLLSRQLLQNLAQVQLLRTASPLSLPSFPKSLIQKFPSLNQAPQLVADLKANALEPYFRKVLAREAQTLAPPSLLSKGPSRIFTEVTKKLATSPKRQSKLLQKLELKLSQISNREFQNLLVEELKASPLPLFSINSALLEKELSFRVASAGAHLALVKTTELLKTEQIKPSLQTRVEILTLIDRLKNPEYSPVDPHPIQDWIRKAKASIQAEAPSLLRSKFETSLLNAVFESQVPNAEFEKTHSIQLATLFHSVASQFSTLEPSEETLQRVGHVLSQGSWKVAASALREEIQQLRTLRTPQLAPFLRSAEAARQLSDRMSSEKQRSLDHLETLFDWLHFGLAESLHEPNPKLSALQFSKTELESYRKQLDWERASTFPVLLQSVRDQQGCLDGDLKKLFREQWESPEKRIQASTLIEKGLLKTEQDILNSLARVTEATSLEELSPLVKSSLFQGMLGSTFATQQDEAKRALLLLDHPTLANHFMHHTVGNTIAYGFTALLITHGTGWLVKPARPLVQAITWGLDPYIKGYLKASLPLIALETLYEGAKLNQQEADLKLFRSFALASSQGSTYAAPESLPSLHTSYEVARALFWGRVTFDTLFMYLPAATETFGHSVLKTGGAP